MAFISAEGRLLRADPEFCHLAGIDPESSLGRTIRELWPDLDLSGEIASARGICEGDASYVTMIRHYPMPSGGGMREAELGLFGVPGDDGTTIISVRLRASGAPLPDRPAAATLSVEDDDTLLAFDQGKVGAAIVGLDGRAWRVNPAMCRICGRSEEEMLSVELLELTHPDDQQRDLELGLPVWVGDAEGWSHEKRLVRPDGSVRWVQQEVVVVRDDAGRPHHFLAQAVDITDRKAAEAELRASRERIHLLTEGLPVGVFEVGVDGVLRSTNPAFDELMGSQRSLVGATMVELIHPDHRDAVVAGFLASVGDGVDWAADVRLVDGPSHRPRWVRATVRSHLDAGGRLASASGALVDVTDEIEARSTSARFAELLADVPDFVAIASTDGQIIYRNPAAAGVMGAPVDDAVVLISLFDDDTQERLYDEVLPALDTEGTWSGELTLIDPDGSLRPTLGSMTLHPDPTTGMEYVTVIARDIADMKAVEALLREQATLDPLTGLLNRAAFHQALALALGRGEGVAVLFVDLDRFKEVNDRWGHDAGDEVLTVVASRLLAAVRDDDLVGRIGGDEFVVLCQVGTVPAAASAVAQRIVDRLVESITWDGREVGVGASVGVAVSGEGDTARSLIRRADAAVYRAKAGGGSQVVIADQG